MPASVLFRVDAERAIGLGHLARCLTLAEAYARAGSRCSFATTTPDEVGRRIEDHALVRIPARAGSPEDAAETARAAAGALATLVVLDDYRFDAAFGARLDIAQCLWIDDGGFAEGRRGHVLNHNLYATSALYPAMDPSRLLLGASFALLRDEFRQARTRRSAVAPASAAAARGRPLRVLVTMGGSDLPNATAAVMAGVMAHRSSRETAVRVLVGAMNPHRDELIARFGDEAECVVDPPAVAPHMQWADVAISAAGGTAMELCCIGIPAIVLAIADNQRPVAEALSRNGLATNLGWFDGATPEAVGAALRALTEKSGVAEAMRARQQATVDGQGSDRVVAATLGATA